MFKRAVILSAILMSFAVNAFAGTMVVNRKAASDSSDITTTWFNTGVTVYTDAIDITRYDGYMSLQMVISGGAPDLDISVEASIDGTNFYTPYDADGTQLWIETAISASRHQQIKLPLAPYIRFKIDPDAETTLTLDYTTREITNR